MSLISTALRQYFYHFPQLCEIIDSTGLCPIEVLDEEKQILCARQFPKFAGYNEDAATGIAAAGLAFGVLGNGIVKSTKKLITVWRGREGVVRLKYL